MKRCRSFTEAYRWKINSYDGDEIAKLHVEICVEANGHRTYEL